MIYKKLYIDSVIKKNIPSNMRAVWKNKTGTNIVRDVY